MVIETERFLLREFTVLDAQSFYELNSNPNVLCFTGDEPFNSLEDAKKFLQNYSSYNNTGYGRWAVIQKSTYRFVGWCGLKYHPVQGYTDLGFRFFERYWNQGIATETGKAVVEYAFKILMLQKLVARVEAENKPSIVVLQKIGFTQVEKIEFNGKHGFLYELNITN